MTWLLSVLIVLACIGGIIFIPYWVGVLIFGRERDEAILQWIYGLGVIIVSALAATCIVSVVICVHNCLF